MEEVVLHRRQQRHDLAVETLGNGQSENGVELIDGAVGLDPRRVLGHSLAAT